MLDLIAIQLADNVKARLISAPMLNEKIESKGKKYIAGFEPATSRLPGVCSTDVPQLLLY